MAPLDMISKAFIVAYLAGSNDPRSTTQIILMRSKTALLKLLPRMVEFLCNATECTSVVMVFWKMTNKRKNITTPSVQMMWVCFIVLL